MDSEPGGRRGIDLDLAEVLELIPHRYPFLMIDRVFDLVPGSHAVGLKNVTANEQFFQGHFPSRPVMPGVMIIESMAQTAAVLVVRTLGEKAEGKLVYFMSIDRARFRKPVFPGDRLLVEVNTQQNRGRVWKFKGLAKVEDETVAEATFAAMIVDK